MTHFGGLSVVQSSATHSGPPNATRAIVTFEFAVRAWWIRCASAFGRLLNTLAQHSLGRLLNTSAQHSCATLTYSKIAKHSCAPNVASGWKYVMHVSSRYSWRAACVISALSNLNA